METSVLERYAIFSFRVELSRVVDSIRLQENVVWQVVTQSYGMGRAIEVQSRPTATDALHNVTTLLVTNCSALTVILITSGFHLV